MAKRQQAPEPFARIPASILRDPTIPSVAKAVAALIDDYGGRNGLCDASAATLAADLGVDEKTVRRAVDLLAARGLIEKRLRGGTQGAGFRRTSVLRLTWAPADDEGTVRTSVSGRPDTRADTDVRTEGDAVTSKDDASSLVGSSGHPSPMNERDERETRPTVLRDGSDSSTSLQVVKPEVAVERNRATPAQRVVADAIDHGRALGKPPIPPRRIGQLAAGVKEALEAGWPEAFTLKATKIAVERGRPDAVVQIGLEMAGRQTSRPGRPARGLDAVEGAKALLAAGYFEGWKEGK